MVNEGMHKAVECQLDSITIAQNPNIIHETDPDPAIANPVSLLLFLPHSIRGWPKVRRRFSEVAAKEEG